MPAPEDEGEVSITPDEREQRLTAELGERGLIGTGVSGELQHYAMSFMQHHGVQTAQLSVNPTNARALAYYRKHGWRDLGLRPGRDNVNLMERDIPVRH